MVDAVMLAFLGDGDSLLVQMLLPAGLALIVIALISRLRKRRNRAAADGNLTAREQLERQRQHKGVRNDLETLMVEIEQLARQMSSQLDAKSIQLERLIRQADERLERLGQATGGAANGAPPPSGEPTAPGMDPLARSVRDLADQGLSPVDIARRLDEHVGKIELILALQAQETNQSQEHP